MYVKNDAGTWLPPKELWVKNDAGTWVKALEVYVKNDSGAWVQSATPENTLNQTIATWTGMTSAADVYLYCRRACTVTLTFTSTGSSGVTRMYQVGEYYNSSGTWTQITGTSPQDVLCIPGRTYRFGGYFAGSGSWALTVTLKSGKLSMERNDYFWKNANGANVW